MSDVLGLDHPLTRACDALEQTIRQMLVSGAVFAGSLAAAVDHTRWALAVVIAAAIVLAAFAITATLRAQTRRDRVLDLILEGRENVPVSLVQRQRRRLASPRMRRALARTIEAMMDETLHPRVLALRSARPFLHRPLIAELQHELRQLAALLHGTQVGVRGIAFTERLLTRGDSALYGRDVTALRDALRRARVLLELV